MNEGNLMPDIHSDVYSNENFFFIFIELLGLNFNNNRCDTRLTSINAISCSKK